MTEYISPECHKEGCKAASEADLVMAKDGHAEEAGGLLTDGQREKVRDAISATLADAMDCTRTWSAWGVGTMSENDFELVADNDERLEELVEAVSMALAGDSPAAVMAGGLLQPLYRWESVKENSRNVGHVVRAAGGFLASTYLPEEAKFIADALNFDTVHRQPAMGSARLAAPAVPDNLGLSDSSLSANPATAHDEPHGFIIKAMIGSAQTSVAVRNIKTARNVSLDGEIAPFWTAPASPSIDATQHAADIATFEALVSAKNDEIDALTGELAALQASPAGAPEASERIALNVYEAQRNAAESLIGDEMERLGLVPKAGPDEVSQSQAILLAGIQGMCISANQELARCDGALSEWDKGWFMGQLHVFDQYTPVEKIAIEQARGYLSKIAAAPLPPVVARKDGEPT